MISPVTLRPVLVLVHPGSACGSADFNLGSSEASDARSRLANDLALWHGDIIVMDGFLSDEIATHPALDEAIQDALRRANPEINNPGMASPDMMQRRNSIGYGPADRHWPSREQLEAIAGSGRIALRIWGCDDVPPHHVEAVDHLVQPFRPGSPPLLDPAAHRIVLTGAWYDPEGEAGCVNAVEDRFRRAGFSTSVLPGAVSLTTARDPGDDLPSSAPLERDTGSMSP